MIEICGVCNLEYNIPIELKCNHIYCFICSTKINNCLECHNPVIYNETNHNVTINSELSYIWLYSSNYNDTWWCYDRENSNHIEYIYNDYVKVNKIKNNISSDYCNDGIEINISNKMVKKSDFKLSSSPMLVEDSFIDMELNDDTDYIYYDDTNLNHNSNKKNMYSTKSSNKLISYNITVNNKIYRMNFDMMKQINVYNPNKKRNIKKIFIEDDIIKSNNMNIINFMKKNKIIGISGKKFEN